MIKNSAIEYPNRWNIEETKWRNGNQTIKSSIAVQEGVSFYTI